jgi:predicted type IV restriction endonuclease
VHTDKEADVNASAEAFTRIANVPVQGLVSEEDVKITIVLPLLRALGYDDADVHYEGWTGRGYMDMVIHRFPVCLVVETKSPRTKRTNEGITQLEAYVFHQHTHDRPATVAMLTNGEVFRLYGVIEPLRRGCLKEQLLYCLTRSQLGDPAWVSQLTELLAREPNEKGTIPQVITRRQEEMHRKRAQLREIEMEIQELTADRDRIDEHIHRRQSERASMAKDLCSDPPPPPSPVCLHILRLLGERGAQSKSAAVQRQMSLPTPLASPLQALTGAAW